MRSTEQIAVAVLKLAISEEPDSRPLANANCDVESCELARLAIEHITSCPSCGAEPWVNIDCDLCMVCNVIARGETPG